MTTDRFCAVSLFRTVFKKGLRVCRRVGRRWQNATSKALALVVGRIKNNGDASLRPPDDPCRPLSARDSPEHGQCGTDVRPDKVEAPPDPPPGIQDHGP